MLQYKKEQRYTEQNKKHIFTSIITGESNDYGKKNYNN